MGRIAAMITRPPMRLLVRELPLAMSIGSPMVPTTATIVRGTIAAIPRRPRHAFTAPNASSAAPPTQATMKNKTPRLAVVLARFPTVPRPVIQSIPRLTASTTSTTE